MKDFDELDNSMDQSSQEELPIFTNKRIVSELISHWYLFFIFLSIGYTGAWIYNRYKKVMYSAQASIMVLEEGSTTFWQRDGGFSGEALRGFGTSYQGIQNQMIILKSKPILARAIRELGFEVSYHREDKISPIETYIDAPFRVEWDRNHPQLIGFNYMISINPDRSMILTGSEEGISCFNYSNNQVEGFFQKIKIEQKIQSGDEVVEHGRYKFKIYLKDGYVPLEQDNFFFLFHKPDELLNSYRSRLLVSLRDWETSIIDITLKDNHPRKAMDFLDKIVEVYRLDNVVRKNEYADQTINFIEYLLKGVSDSLTIAEGELLSFQSNHKIIDIGSQTGQLLSQMSELDSRKTELETEIKYYSYLKNYIQKNRDIGALLAPSSVGISDPLLSGMISEFNSLTVEKSKLDDVLIAPRMTQLNTRIENIRAGMLENIDNILSQNDQAMTDLNRRQSLIEAKVGRLPVTERDLLNIQRKYNLNNETYTFLLEKLSEAQIAKAANQPESHVIEEAESLGPIGPDKKKAYSYGLFAGIVPPIIYVLLIILFNNKVISKEDVEMISRLPILNMVFFNKMNVPTNTPVLDQPNSPDSEAYRSLRGKLDLMTKGKDKPVIAVSSTGPGEGKTYSAINIASSYALTRRKTLLLDFDLRNSRINEDFKLDASKGVVSYILGKDTLQQITHQVKHPFFHIIPAGPIPPNPGEMLTDHKVKTMLQELKETYDVIIIDSAPIGYVTDLFQITNLIDTTVFVIRDSFTNRKLLKQALDEIKMYNIKGVGILINAIKTTGGLFPAYVLSYVNGYRYGYGYGYGYRYGYGGYGSKSPDYYGYGDKHKRKRFKLPLIKSSDEEETNGNGNHHGRPEMS